MSAEVSQGLESIGLTEETNNEYSGDTPSQDYFKIDSTEDFGHIEFDLLSPELIRKFHFADLDLAYDFYNEYGRAIGFSIRKHKVGYTRSGEPKGILWKSFFCSRHGVREPKMAENSNRQREAKANTRCGCNAMFRVHVDSSGSRWIVSSFEIEHNHELLRSKFVGRLRSHRVMSEADVAEMNSMRNVGITTPKIYAAFARQSGGFDKVGFGKKSMYNEIDKQRKMRGGDAKSAIRYLQQMCTLDPLMYWKHEVDDEGNLRHIFWADGFSQIDYSVFGELLAFDATYGRNKYKLPIVVFSGVNHHMQTVVFGCGIVSDETETTYTWLLEQFLLAMKGKSPKAVITDGDLSMRNAIARVFPEAHHRLCGWHLLRNATTNVGKPKFKEGFRRCMLNDYEVNEFEAEWKAVVRENGVEDVPWVQGIYARKKMWAVAHMRGKFFAGVRTTSRCEGLHTQIGKYVGSRDNLYEFIVHFERCLNYMRNNEVEADFRSSYGDPVVQTYVPSLEIAASKVYTRHMFYQFREVLHKLGSVKVTGQKKTASSVIYVVSKYTTGKRRSRFHVSHYVADNEFRCACRRMESLGLPCVHIVSVVVYLDIHPLPDSLILKRWCKNAKEGLDSRMAHDMGTDMGNRMSRFGVLQHCCRRLCSVASRSLDDFNRIREKVNAEVEQLLSTNISSIPFDLHDNVRDPVVVLSKGCGSSSQYREKKSQKIQKCTTCRTVGHNKRKCPFETEVNEEMLEDSCSEGDVE